MCSLCASNTGQEAPDTELEGRHLRIPSLFAHARAGSKRTAGRASVRVAEQLGGALATLAHDSAGAVLRGLLQGLLHCASLQDICSIHMLTHPAPGLCLQGYGARAHGHQPHLRIYPWQGRLLPHAGKLDRTGQKALLGLLQVGPTLHYKLWPWPVSVWATFTSRAPALWFLPARKVE